MFARLIALLVALAACSEKEKPIAPHPGGLEVVYTGASPRHLLQYQLTTGAKIPLELSIDVELDAGGRGGPLPTVTITCELTVEDVKPDRSARVRITFVSITASERANSTLSAASMTEHMQLLRGTSLVGTLDPTGPIRDLHAEAAERLPPALAQQLETVSRSFQQVAMPLPHVPVGAGAAWRHKRTIEQAGLKLYSVTTVVASSVTPTSFTFTTTTALGGSDQKVTLSGHEIHTTNIGGTGNGKGTVDLAAMAFTGEMTLAFHGDMTADGQTDEMGMVMTTRIGAGKPAELAGSGSAAPPITDEVEPPPDLAAPDNTPHSGENQPAPAP